ncbi:MAG: hypothetical protein H0V61_02475 [Chitinophagales bacterium]|nr:hypothetical protein [Chitinophagales bacterium]
MAVFIYIINCSFLSAQSPNVISFKLGEVAYTDWWNRYGLQPTLSYSHLFANNLKFSTDISGYYFERKNELLTYEPGGFLESKVFIEGNYKLGYQFSSKDKLKTSVGSGLSVRLRSDNIAFSGLHSGGFYESVVIGYGGIEVGAVLYHESNYSLTDNFSIGIYSQANLYLPTRDAPNSNYNTHRSPSAFSYGLAANFYIGKKKIE